MSGVGCRAAASAPPRDTFNGEKCENEQREEGRVSSGVCPVARGACAHPPPPAAHCSDRPTLPSRRQSSARARPDRPSRRPLPSSSLLSLAIGTMLIGLVRDSVMQCFCHTCRAPVLPAGSVTDHRPLPAPAPRPHTLTAGNCVQLPMDLKS